MSNYRRGRRLEQAIAKFLGGRRMGNTGLATADVEVGEWLVVEVKQRKRLPAWIKKALAQAIHSAESHQLPVAILHEQYQPYDESLVVMRMADFCAWFGDELAKVNLR